MQLPTKINLDGSYRPNASLRHAFPGYGRQRTSQNDDSRHDPDAVSFHRAKTQDTPCEWHNITSPLSTIKEFHAEFYARSYGTSARRWRYMPTLEMSWYRKPCKSGSTTHPVSWTQLGLVALTR